MPEERRPIPDAEEVASALKVIIGPRFAVPAWADDDDVTKASAALTLELIGGPAKPRTPSEREERLEKLRTLLRKLALRLRELTPREIEEARIQLDLGSDIEDAYAQEASRLADAATTVFRLDPEDRRPKSLPKQKLYEHAQAHWEAGPELSRGKRWFERSRLKPLLSTLAEWIVEYEKAYRARSLPAEETKGNGKSSAKGQGIESDIQTEASNGEAEARREPATAQTPPDKVAERPPAKADAPSEADGSAAARPSEASPSGAPPQRSASRAPGPEPDSDEELIGNTATGIIVLIIVLVFSLIFNPKDELASRFNELKAELGLSRSPEQRPPPIQPETSPTPPPSKEFGGGQSELYQPKCGVLAASGTDSDDKHRRLAAVDMAVGARRIRQPPDTYPDLPFGQVVKIRPFEVVQVSAIVQNAGPAAVARDVQLRVSFPADSSTRTTISASAEAANTRPSDSYRTSGVVALVSLTGQPFRLGNFRGVTVQRNERTESIYWGRFEHFPLCALESKRTDDSFELVTPSPSIDGTLGVGLDDAYRLSVLADVMPG